MKFIKLAFFLLVAMFIAVIGFFIRQTYINNYAKAYSKKVTNNTGTFHCNEPLENYVPNTPNLAFFKAYYGPDSCYYISVSNIRSSNFHEIVISPSNKLTETELFENSTTYKYSFYDFQKLDKIKTKLNFSPRFEDVIDDVLPKIIHLSYRDLETICREQRSCVMNGYILLPRPFSPEDIPDNPEMINYIQKFFNTYVDTQLVHELIHYLNQKYSLSYSTLVKDNINGTFCFTSGAGYYPNYIAYDISKFKPGYIVNGSSNIEISSKKDNLEGYYFSNGKEYIPTLAELVFLMSSFTIGDNYLTEDQIKSNLSEFKIGYMKSFTDNDIEKIALLAKLILNNITSAPDKYHFFDPFYNYEQFIFTTDQIGSIFNTRSSGYSTNVEHGIIEYITFTNKINSSMTPLMDSYILKMEAPNISTIEEFCINQKKFKIKDFNNKKFN